MKDSAVDRHPCPYCGTMVDEDDCVESDIPAVNGPMLHTASQCREYVYACMTSYMRDVGTLRAALAGAASALRDAGNGAPLSCAKLAGELADKALGPSYVGGRPGSRYYENRRTDPAEER